MKITLAHAGKQHSYQVARVMKNLGVLQRFYTSSYVSNKFIQNQWKYNKWLQRRFVEGVAGKDVDANWRFELKEQFFRRLGGNFTGFRNAVYERDKSFDTYMAKKIQTIESDVFWGFQGSCFATLQTAKLGGKCTACELASAHIVEIKKILSEESLLHPEWAHTIDSFKFPDGYEQRLEQEPHVADWVIVASEFSKQSLLKSGVNEDKIKKLPLGFDFHHILRQNDFLLKERKKTLRVLYVGRISQGKGIKYLLEAMKSFHKTEVELHIIGNVNNASQPLNQYKHLFTFHGSMAQNELYNLYYEYDALILPSVFEGFGLVIVEAMAAGLPVITTPNTFGPEIITNDKNGYIVPIRDVQALEKAIQKLCSKSADEFMEMRLQAREAALRFSWEAYQDRLAVVLKAITAA